MWQKVIAMLELPSTKMLLTQQAKLINLNIDSAEIAISEKWINMIQSRKNLIEDDLQSEDESDCDEDKMSILPT